MATGLMYIVDAGSDRGKRKKYNEDSVFAISRVGDLETLPFGLFIVADGMGAYADGQEASCGAIQAMIDCILPTIANSKTLEPGACAALLVDVVQRANDAVNQQNVRLQRREGADIDVGVGVTITAAMIVDSMAYVANVGDCRTYHYRPGEGLKQVTRDHLIITRMVEEGKLPPEAMYTHHLRNLIYRMLGYESHVEVDTFTVSLRAGDAILLCSRGLWYMVRDPDMEDTLKHSLDDPVQGAEALIQTALENGGVANASVIVVLVTETQEQALVPSVQVLAEPARIQVPSS